MRARREYICYEKLVYDSELERLSESGYRIVRQDKKVTILEDRQGERIIVRLSVGVAA